MYKLRHFSLFLFQAQNWDRLPALRELAASGRSPFMKDLQSIEHAEGVQLIIKSADSHYYIESNLFSKGMYLNMLKEDEVNGRGCKYLQASEEEERYDALFDEF